MSVLKAIPRFIATYNSTLTNKNVWAAKQIPDFTGINQEPFQCDTEPNLSKQSLRDIFVKEICLCTYEVNHRQHNNDELPFYPLVLFTSEQQFEFS